MAELHSEQRVEQACRRLERAVTRLEVALGRQKETATAQIESLKRALAAAAAEKAELESLKTAVAGRLELAIHRLKGVLEG